MILARPPFENFFRGHVGIVLGACLPNFKSVSLAILELLAFNSPKFFGVTWPWLCPLFLLF